MWWRWMPVSGLKNEKQDFIFILGVAVLLLPFLSAGLFTNGIMLLMRLMA